MPIFLSKQISNPKHYHQLCTSIDSILVFLIFPKVFVVVRKNLKVDLLLYLQKSLVVSFTIRIPVVICMALQIKLFNLLRVAKDTLKGVFWYDKLVKDSYLCVSLICLRYISRLIEQTLLIHFSWYLRSKMTYTNIIMSCQCIQHVFFFQMEQGQS